MDQPRPQRVVVMTGATGGLGAHALQHIAAQPDTRVIVGARGVRRAVPRGVETLPLELASLARVRQFANAVIERLGGGGIDILILNAGIHVSDTRRRSVDGFELTFAVNHLAHYLLARLLLPYMAEHGRLVITTSNMHNPPIKRLAPKAVEPEAWAHPTGTGAGGVRAYAASKLCNLMTAQSLSALDEVKARGIDVVAFNPGLTGGSSGRDSPQAARILVQLLMGTVFRLVGLFRPEFVMNKPEHSGRMLAEVALGALAPTTGVYVSLVKGRPTFPQPSDLARNRDAQGRLWRESAAMVGLA